MKLIRRLVLAVVLLIVIAVGIVFILNCVQRLQRWSIAEVEVGRFLISAAPN